jgi:hypothetical protein
VTRSLPVLLALAVAGLSPALAQDVPTPPVPPPHDHRSSVPGSIQDADDGRCEARTLSHLDGIGASTSLSVVREGGAWHIELERVTLADEQGVASEQKFDVYVKSSHAVDQGLDALFREAPDDPAEWERRLESITRVDIDLARPDPALTEPLLAPRPPRWSRPERWFDDLRDQWRDRERAWTPELRRWRREGDGCYGRCHGRRDLERRVDRDAPSKGRLYY